MVTTTSSSTAGTGSIQMPSGWLAAAEQSARQQEEVEAAVLAHFQALRRLGHTQVTVTEVANALRLTSVTVLDAVKRLTDRGVKLLG